MREDRFYSPRADSCRLNVFIAFKKYAQKWVREVKTRHRPDSAHPDGRTKESPSCHPRISVFEPQDSKHGGALFCGSKIVGTPNLVEFEKVYDRNGNLLDQEAPWVQEMRDVQRDVRSFYDRSNVFFPERQKDWEDFFAYDVPWKGLPDVPEERLPVWTLDLPDEPLQPPDEREAAAEQILADTGFDEEGKLRYLYRDGVDIANYVPVQLRATFNGRFMDGVKHVAADDKLGESAFEIIDFRRSSIAFQVGIKRFLARNRSGAVAQPGCGGHLCWSFP